MISLNNRQKLLLKLGCKIVLDDLWHMLFCLLEIERKFKCIAVKREIQNIKDIFE